MFNYYFQTQLNKSPLWAEKKHVRQKKDAYSHRKLYQVMKVVDDQATPPDIKKYKLETYRGTGQVVIAAFFINFPETQYATLISE